MSADPISAVADLASGIIDRIFPDATEAAKAKLTLAQMQANGELAKLAASTDLLKGQMAIDQAEASSASVFVAGWRPMVGWCCAVAVGFQFVIAPFATWGAGLAGHPLAFPPLDTGTLLALLGSLLGVGTLRTVEKINGVASGAH